VLGVSASRVVMVPSRNGGEVRGVPASGALVKRRRWAGRHATMERVPPVTGGSAEPAGQAAANDYDSFAEAYSAENEVSLFNAYYERPAILALAGDVAGRRVLDAGCGSGPLFAALRDRGAIVTGFDQSAKMLEIARRRLGDGADLRVADLGRPLPFPDGAFDDVIASLVLHYLQDWTAPLAELRRVLRPGGRLIASVDHPLQGHPLLRPGTDYFATYERTEEWTFGGRSVPMRFWHRPLPAMISAFTRAGFRIAVIDEPLLAPDTPRELLPDFREADILCFIFFVLEAG
jgi:SAM-dependent methyltransferase